MAIIAELNPDIKKLIDNIELSEDLTIDDLNWVFHRLNQDYGPSDGLTQMTAHIQYLCCRLEDAYGIDAARACMFMHVYSAGAPDEVLSDVKRISTFH
jgi:hypothetical protein